MAFTTFPYIEGLTWKPQDCYTLLKSAGIRLKDNGRWRVPAELTEEEKSQLLNAISKFVSNSNETSAILLRELYGYTYTINGEDRCNLLREARGYATMLNACGRIGKAGVGISICMGDRNEMLTIGEQITETYMNTLRNCISTLFAGKWRIMDDGKNVFINGEGVIPEDMLGAVSSLLSGSLSFNGRLLFVRTLAGDGSYKFSSRKCLGCNSNLDLGQIMRQVSYTFQGVGGGHSSAAGSKIPQTALDGFIANIKSFTSEPKVGPTSS
jgi:RecJ-like exonuclease